MDPTRKTTRKQKVLLGSLGGLLASLAFFDGVGSLLALTVTVTALMALFLSEERERRQAPKGYWILNELLLRQPHHAEDDEPAHLWWLDLWLKGAEATKNLGETIANLGDWLNEEEK